MRKRLTKEIKAKIISLYGDKCINCGSSEEIEFHHVVPLEIGGNDTPENIVPLCYSCHKAVTNHELVLATTGRKHTAGGRKRKIPKNYKDILRQYIDCRFGKAECIKRLGLSSRNGLTDNPWYTEFLRENGIESVRNNIDILSSKRPMIEDGQRVGRKVYVDGRREEVFWHGAPLVVDSVRQIEFVFSDSETPVGASEYKVTTKTKNEKKARVSRKSGVDKGWWHEYKRSLHNYQEV